MSGAPRADVCVHTRVRGFGWGGVWLGQAAQHHVGLWLAGLRLRDPPSPGTGTPSPRLRWWCAPEIKGALRTSAHTRGGGGVRRCDRVVVQGAPSRRCWGAGAAAPGHVQQNEGVGGGTAATRSHWGRRSDRQWDMPRSSRGAVCLASSTAQHFSVHHQTGGSAAAAPALALLLIAPQENASVRRAADVCPSPLLRLRRSWLCCYSPRRMSLCSPLVGPEAVREGVRGHEAVVLVSAPIGHSPPLILTLCGPECVLVVSTEPPDDLSRLTTPGLGRPGDGGRCP